MKIIAICSNPYPSGSVVRTKYILRSLRNFGHEATLIPPIRRLPFFLNLLISLILNLIFLIPKKTDIVWVSKPNLNTFLPAIMKKYLGAKIILDMDDLSFLYYKNGLIKKITKLFELSFPKLFDLVVVNQRDIGIFLKKTLAIPPKKIFLLENGVDTQIFNPDRFKNIEEKKKKILLYIAHLDISSDLEPIISVFKNLVKELPDTVLLIVGGGSKLKYFKNLIKDLKLSNKVKFLGEVEPLSVPNIVQKADCCLAYLDPENPGNKYRTLMKVREALAMRKPVVCNDFGDLKRFAKFTFQAKGGNLKEFKTLIKKILRNDFERKKIDLGQKFVRNNFDWKLLVPGLNKKILEITKLTS